MRSLWFRLLITFSLVVLVAIGTVALYVRQSTVPRIASYVAAVNTKDQKMVASLLATSTELHDPAQIQGIVKKLAQATGQRIIFVDQSHTVIGDSEGTMLGQTLPERNVRINGVALAGPFPLAKLPAASVGGTLVVMPGLNIGEKVPGAVFLQPAPTPRIAFTYDASGLNATTEDRFVAGVNRSLLLAALLAGLLGIILTVLLSARILRPVRALTRAAQQLQKGDLSQRVAVRSKDEFGDLARAFNAMADSLAHSEQLRRNLVGDVAHDLRTPLTNIRGYLEALEDGVMPATPRTMLSLREEVLLLNRLIDDLQELALAEAGLLRLICRPIDLAQVIDQTAAVMAPQVARKRLTLATHVPPGLPLALADAERVGQVLRNLLSNAVTHTPTGGTIRLDASAEPIGDTITIHVTDSGEGIPVEHVPNIFERFYRVDPSRSRTTGGSGLGLAIVKELVQKQGGQVEVKSIVGEGSTFTFTLPVAATRQQCTLG
ncbi:MAG TPA: ATP-binding protein [Chloroflexota bacterium]